jgi:hypothetical protein
MIKVVFLIKLNELTKMQGVFSKFEAANTNVSTLQQNLIDAKRNNAGNSYNTVVSKAQSALDKALDIRTQIAKEIEKSSVFQPKENVTVEQKLTNAASPVDNTPKATYEERQQKANAEFGSTQSAKEFNLKRLKLLDLSGKTDTDFSKSR